MVGPSSQKYNGWQLHASMSISNGLRGVIGYPVYLYKVLSLRYRVLASEEVLPLQYRSTLEADNRLGLRAGETQGPIHD